MHVVPPPPLELEGTLLYMSNSAPLACSHMHHGHAADRTARMAHAHGAMAPSCTCTHRRIVHILSVRITDQTAESDSAHTAAGAGDESLACGVGQLWANYPIPLPAARTHSHSSSPRVGLQSCMCAGVASCTCAR